MRYPIRGVTLIELVMVMVVVGILAAATAMINLNAGVQHRVVVKADEFRRAISHAQLLAISQSVRLRLTTSATGYLVQQCVPSTPPSSYDPCASITSLTDPATGGLFSADFSGENVTLSVEPSSGATIDFDSMGRPQSGGTLLTRTTTFTFTGGNNSASVSVLPITGFARAS